MKLATCLRNWLIRCRNQQQIYAICDILTQCITYSRKANVNESSNSIETKQPDEVKKELHSRIFKDNAFELFEKYYNNKAMNFQSRTDFRFLFEQMKIDNLIHETVSLGQYLKFIGNYGYAEKELKAIQMNTTKNIQRLKDYNEYKDNLKTTLK